MAGYGTIAPGSDRENDLVDQYYDPMTGLQVGGGNTGPPMPRKPKTWVMEPDLINTQMGNWGPGVTTDDQGNPISEETGQPLKVVRRPGVLPIAKTPDGYTMTTPKMLDLASYIIGGPVKLAPGETAFGSGMIKKAVEARKPTGLARKAVEEVATGTAPIQPTPGTPPGEAPRPVQATSINWDRSSTQRGVGGLGNRTVMDVPTKALLDAHMGTDPDMAVAQAKQQVLDHMASGKPISLPEVGIQSKFDSDHPLLQELYFSNGRNRVAAAHAMGAETVPVVVEKGDEQKLLALLERYKSSPGAMPQLAERYPEVGPPTLKYKGTAKPVPAGDIPTGDELARRMELPKTDPQAVYDAKENTAEAEKLRKLRLGMKADIEAGNYEPYFPPAQRQDVEPQFGYDPHHDTSQNLMKTPATREQYDIAAQHPEAVRRLNEAYDRGLQQKSGAENWYFMRQLQEEFIRELGPEEGRRMFKERFADAMAATTGGMDPTSNLLMAHYGNYLKTQGLSEVPATHQLPHPIGGQYAARNMDQFRDMIMQGEGIDPLSNEKRYNFSQNFLGRAGQGTIDEQMSRLWFPGGEAPPEGLKGAAATLFKKGMEKPPSGSYGHFERVLQQLAAERGVDPRYFQEVAWAGAKDMNTPGGYVAKPMISHVNDAIERTHRITGMPRTEIVRRGLVRGEIPLYAKGGPGGITGFGSIAPRRQEDE